MEHCYSKVLSRWFRVPANPPVSEYIKKVGIPTTSVQCAYYMENVLGLAPSEEQADGSILLINPLPDDTEIPTVPISQLGLWVRLALRDFDKWQGQELEAMSDLKSNAQIAQILTEVTGRKFETQHNTPEQFLADKSQAKEMKINSMVFFEK